MKQQYAIFVATRIEGERSLVNWTQFERFYDSFEAAVATYHNLKKHVVDVVIYNKSFSDVYGASLLGNTKVLNSAEMKVLDEEQPIDVY